MEPVPNPNVPLGSNKFVDSKTGKPTLLNCIFERVSPKPIEKPPKTQIISSAEEKTRFALDTG